MFMEYFIAKDEWAAIHKCWWCVKARIRPFGRSVVRFILLFGLPISHTRPKRMRGNKLKWKYISKYITERVYNMKSWHIIVECKQVLFKCLRMFDTFLSGHIYAGGVVLGHATLIYCLVRSAVSFRTVWHQVLFFIFDTMSHWSQHTQPSLEYFIFHCCFGSCRCQKCPYLLTFNCFKFFFLAAFSLFLVCKWVRLTFKSHEEGS